MEQQLESNIAEIDNSFAVVVKTQEDIINELDFKTEEDKRLCIDIIDSLGLSIANTIRQQKVAQIPLIGCVRINPVRKKFNESRKTFSAIRNNTTKEGYRQYIKDFIGELKEKQKEKDEYKLIITRIKKVNKKKYDYLARNLGRAYAELFIMSIYWLKEVPFDADWEEWYQSLKE